MPLSVAIKWSKSTKEFISDASNCIKQNTNTVLHMESWPVFHNKLDLVNSFQLFIADGAKQWFNDIPLEVLEWERLEAQLAEELADFVQVERLDIEDVKLDLEQLDLVSIFLGCWREWRVEQVQQVRVLG